MQLSDIRSWIDTQQELIEKTLCELVEINTYTDNKAGVDDGMDYISQLAQNLGLVVEVVNGRHRLIKAGNGTSKPRIMLVTHMDTVFPPDGDFLRYEPLGNGFIQGPGTGDIKGGTCVGLWSMLALRQLATDFDVQMIISADEEKGSPTIRDWYTGGHIKANYAIGLEPGFPQGELSPDVDLGVVYQRRGYGAIKYTITGKAAHSGSAHLGVDAVVAAAERIVKINALNDWDNGVSVTCGMIEGGISPNTVAGQVKGSVSWRFERLEDGERIKAQVEEILSDTYVHNDDLGLVDTVEYYIDAFLPPMERTEENMKVVDIVLAEAKRLNQNVVPIARGGGSDANFVSMSGTPCICGMGVPTEGLHTVNEKIYLPGLYDRIELLTSTLYRIVVEGALD